MQFSIMFILFLWIVLVIIPDLRYEVPWVDDHASQSESIPSANLWKSILFHF